MPASPVGTEITAVRQIALTVSDVARATAFYRDALGLRFLFSARHVSTGAILLQSAQGAA